MKIAIGCDQNGYALKLELIKFLKEKNIEHIDFGCGEGETVYYPKVALKVSEEVAKGNFDRGILICGTGIGMAITANKVPGIRAAVCHDIYSAERAQKSNNAQIATFGAEVIGPSLAKYLLNIWLNSEFKDGRSTPKVELINEIDENFRKKI
ncbi:putative sugar phosphate isomerase YwlF [Clostridium ragsdalei P11]|uniref:Putative sugar phosphate isomerase YwlF n=1 Tax=Clostridium ragsdalei P11 TaxID=1353534 RepID=A0A1A6AS74_9CLOT|nr:ribose 5-phosphate isomerase B [Clostridium ragsdalei]OBR92893.1 putative sugar phosphate isomerase YwlF [Clostridium ragsdalei P11]